MVTCAAVFRTPLCWQPCVCVRTLITSLCHYHCVCVCHVGCVAAEMCVQWCQLCWCVCRCNVMQRWRSPSVSMKERWPAACDWLFAQLKQKHQHRDCILLRHELIRWTRIKINSADGLSGFSSKSETMDRFLLWEVGNRVISSLIFTQFPFQIISNCLIEIACVM